MDEMEFDKTRKTLGTDQLANKDRKEMLGKFTEAGGEVLSERSIRKKQLEQERSKSGGGDATGAGSRGRGGGPDLRLPSEIAREKNRLAQEKISQSRQKKDSEEREAKSFVNKFFIKFNCAMKGITPYGQNMVKPKFLSLLNLDAKRALMECQILGNDLFANNKNTALKIVKELDQKNPLLIELLERGTELYNRNDLAELTGSYSPGSSNSIPLDSLRAGIYSLTRKLYYFLPYNETYMVAAGLAIDIQEKTEKKHAGLYAAKKKKIRQEWRILMNIIFPGLVLLVQRSEMKRAEPGSRLFEEMISILEEDRIGRRSAGDSVGNIPEDKKKDSKEESDAEDEEDTEEAEEYEEKEMSKELAYGYKIMKLYPVAALRKKHDKPGEFKDFSDRDKVFIAMLFFKEFEEEYSFILTTPKISFNLTYEGGVKQDFHQKLSDIFEEARIVHDMFRKYIHDAQEYKKAGQDSGKSSNHMEHTKRLEKLEGKMGASGRESKIQLIDYCDKIIGNFEILIEDMRGENDIITNKDATITFDLDRDKKKRLNGKAVKDCIMQAYCYLLGLSDRLRDGDLYGGVIDMTDDEFARAFLNPGSEA